MVSPEFDLDFEIDLESDSHGAFDETLVADMTGPSLAPDPAFTTSDELKRSAVAARVAEQVPARVPARVPAAVPAMVPAGPSLFVFEPGGNAVEDVLRRGGVDSRTVGLGGDLMSAAQAGEVSGVIFSPGMDEEMRYFLVRALRGRFPKIPLIATSPFAHDAAKRQALLDSGLRAVLPWPLPPASDLLPALDSLLLVSPSADSVPLRGSEVALHELALLRQKVAVLEKERTEVRAKVINPETFEKAVKEVAEKTAENTSLRSDVTVLRQRADILEERNARLTLELERLRTDEMTRVLPPPSEHGRRISDELVVLLEGADAFLWPLNQAIDFFDDLAHEAAQERAPSLQTHVRSLKLLQGLLDRLREGFHDDK